MAADRPGPAGGLVGRTVERGVLDEALSSARAELVALYGRRRVGKTFLVREHVQPQVDVYFEVVGHRDAVIDVQLHHVGESLRRAFGTERVDPRSWVEAFAALCDEVEARPDQRIALFFDELPWLATRRSGLLSALDHAWNARLSRCPHLTVLVSGSAASWVVSNLIQARGGLHNRVTRQLPLKPFTFPEACELLRSRRCSMNQHQALALYMAIGGVPWYLEQVRPGQSAAQAIDALCFGAQSPLRGEFGRLFRALFADGEVHERVVRAIASRRSGMSRGELVEQLDLSSGGSLSRKLTDLEHAGFIARVTPYDRRRREAWYRIDDPFVYLHLRWIEQAPRGVFESASTHWWLEQVGTPAWYAWAGHQFEMVCMRHAAWVKRALGLEGVAARVGSWAWRPPRGSRDARGAQIDLLFDRVDGIVTLCELKHTDDVFSVSKAYARDLAHKVSVFEARSGTRKQVELALVTTHGLRRNIWSEDLVTHAISVTDLFPEVA